MEYSEEEIKSKYKELYPLYNRACLNVKEALIIFLEESNIPFFTITTRVKEYSSFVSKVSKKGYLSPFENNEDFAGVRVILYYLEDIDRLKELINREFDVQISEDKSDKLDVNEFGYRSYHYIVKIKSSWLNSPNYRGLENIKIEIQIRTVLMHAWAEIEHKLGYKNKNQVPDEVKRKFSRLSAKLEEADEQFQELKIKIENYQQELLSEAKKEGTFKGEELNVSSLQALLDFYFPNQEKSNHPPTRLLNTIAEYHLSLSDIIKLAEKVQPFAEMIDKKIFPNSNLKSNQENIMNYGIEAFFPDANLSKCSKSRLRIIKMINPNISSV